MDFLPEVIKSRLGLEPKGGKTLLPVCLVSHLGVVACHPGCNHMASPSLSSRVAGLHYGKDRGRNACPDETCIVYL